MADGVTYSIEMDARLSGEQSISQLESLADSLEKASKSSTSFDRAIASVKAELSGLEKGSEQANKLAATLKKLEKGAKLESTAAGGKNMGEAFEKLGGVLGRFGGPLGRIGQQGAGAAGSLAKMSSALGGITAAGVASVAVLAAIAAGLVAITVATVSYGIASSDAARSDALQTEAIIANGRALAGLADIIPEVQDATELGREDIERLAQSLDEAKVSAEDMPAALIAMAKAETALGKGGASKFIESLKSGKKTVDQIADEIEKKFGGIVEEKLVSLPFLAARAKRGLASITGGLNLDNFLSGLETVVKLLDTSTVSGGVLRDIFQGIVQPIIDGVAEAAPIVEAFILGAEISALQLYIALRRISDPIREFFGIVPENDFIDWLEVAETAGKLFIGMAFGMVAVLGVLTAALAAPVAGFVALYSVVGLAVDLGANIIAGLVNGIKSGAANVISSISETVTGAINTAKKLLGIASPSKVFAEIGGFTAEGFSEGVEDETPGAHNALESLALPPQPSANAAALSASAASGSARGGHTFNLSFSGVSKDTAESIAERVRQIITEIYETDALTLGAEAAT